MGTDLVRKFDMMRGGGSDYLCDHETAFRVWTRIEGVKSVSLLGCRKRGASGDLLLAASSDFKLSQ